MERLLWLLEPVDPLDAVNDWPSWGQDMGYVISAESESEARFLAAKKAEDAEGGKHGCENWQIAAMTSCIAIGISSVPESKILLASNVGS